MRHTLRRNLSALRFVCGWTILAAACDPDSICPKAERSAGHSSAIRVEASRCARHSPTYSHECVAVSRSGRLQGDAEESAPVAAQGFLPGSCHAQGWSSGQPPLECLRYQDGSCFDSLQHRPGGLAARPFPRSNSATFSDVGTHMWYPRAVFGPNRRPYKQRNPLCERVSVL